MSHQSSKPSIKSPVNILHHIFIMTISRNLINRFTIKLKIHSVIRSSTRVTQWVKEGVLEKLTVFRENITLFFYTSNTTGWMPFRIILGIHICLQIRIIDLWCYDFIRYLNTQRLLIRYRFRTLAYMLKMSQDHYVNWGKHYNWMNRS